MTVPSVQQVRYAVPYVSVVRVTPDCPYRSVVDDIKPASNVYTAALIGEIKA